MKDYKRNVEWEDQVLSLGCVYAPTQDKPGDQAKFADSLESLAEGMSLENVLWGGDFNCILIPHLDKSSDSQTSVASENHRGRLKNIMENFSLTDVWRVRHPDSKGYTFRKRNYASRLDFFLVSDHLSEGVTKLKVIENVQSDHSIVTMHINNVRAPKGPGIWRLGTDLLVSDEFIEQCSSFLQDWETPPELTDPTVIWDWYKTEIRRFIRGYTKELRSKEGQLIADLQSQLEGLYDSADAGETISAEELESLKRELREIEEEKASKLIFRSRSRWVQLGEKPTGYFLNLEKRARRDRQLTTIFNEEGQLTSEPASVLATCKDFYQKLYQEDNSEMSSIIEIQEHLQSLEGPKLSQTERDELDAPFSKDELHRALLQLNTNKCPGTDGLPPEFYLKFWELISPYLMRSLSHSAQTGYLSTEQRRGLISLVPKRDQDRRHVSNWRPITLLNADYKILTEAMALRLQNHLPKLVNPN